jgi:lysophospholipase L1-like esterase
MELYAFGCSFTDGVGLHDNKSEAYPILLGKKLGLNVYNMGSAGQSNDYIFRNVFAHLKTHIKKDDIVLVQWTHYIRKEIPIQYNNRNLYLVAPNCFNALQTGRADNLSKNCVGEYVNQNLEKDNEQIKLEYKDFYNDYILRALHEHYQIITTENYINALYTYLEHNGYKHIHFFGWDSCKEPFNFYYNKILEDTFGGYTNTLNNDHPDKIGHEKWANYLEEKIKKLL